MCGSAEVDLEVQEVLFPAGWSPPTATRYRFGGGYFSTASLKRDLEGQRYLFHAKEIPGAEPLTFGPSYPWVLGKSPEEAKAVQEALRSCPR